MKKILSIAMFLSILFGSVVNIYASTSFLDEEHNCCIMSENTPVLDTTSSIMPRTISQLPSSVDLSQDNAFPCIRYQVGPACVAWASTYYQFGYQVAAMNNWNAKNDDSKQFAPKWTFNLVTNEGNAILYDDAYELLSTQGAVKYSQFPSSTLESNSLERKEWYTHTEGIREALRYRVSNVQYLCFADSTVNTPITSPSSAALTTMKQYINTGHILTFSTNCRSWIYKRLVQQYDESLNNQYVCTMLDNSIGGYSGHALSVVGYDDNIQCDIDDDGTIRDYEKGAFKVVDSSNTSNRNQGFIWIMYDALNKVSNAELDNVVHNTIFDNYAYYVIDVAEYPLDLLAEVTVECSSKSSVKIDLGTSSMYETEFEDVASTLFNRHGFKTNFSGSGKTAEVATFVFDFGNICCTPAPWKQYGISVLNVNSEYPFTIENIKIKDKTGKIVVEDTDEKTLLNSSNSYMYGIAMVGDVDNNGDITTNDGTLIQRHLAKYITLTDAQKAIADVDGDGIVNIYDKMYIDKYLAGLSDGFINGEYVCIE